jgi:HSP20 family protein
MLARNRENLPAIFDDFFRPWNEWFDNDRLINRAITVPAVNISEEDKGYKVTMAVPGMKKDDFRVDVTGNIITISASKEEEKEDSNKKYTRKEYNYSSFTRSFTMPEEVNKKAIDASYDNGVLTLNLPKTGESKSREGKSIKVN